MIDPSARADAVETLRRICAGEVDCSDALWELHERVVGGSGGKDRSLREIVEELAEDHLMTLPMHPGDDGSRVRPGDVARMERAVVFLEAGREIPKEKWGWSDWGWLAINPFLMIVVLIVLEVGGGYVDWGWVEGVGKGDIHIYDVK